VKLHPIILLLFIFIISSCTKEIDRIAIESQNIVKKQIIITQPGNIELWVDLDIQYSGEISLLNHISLTKDDMIIAQDTCNALEVDLRYNYHSVNFSDNDIHENKYKGRLYFRSGTLKIGNYVLEIEPEIIGDVHKLNKYDIIIKQ
jgi:hypothetical protein